MLALIPLAQVLIAEGLWEHRFQLRLNQPSWDSGYLGVDAGACLVALRLNLA